VGNPSALVVTIRVDTTVTVGVEDIKDDDEEPVLEGVALELVTELELVLEEGFGVVTLDEESGLVLDDAGGVVELLEDGLVVDEEDGGALDDGGSEEAGEEVSEEDEEERVGEEEDMKV